MLDYILVMFIHLLIITIIIIPSLHTIQWTIIIDNHYYC